LSTTVDAAREAGVGCILNTATSLATAEQVIRQCALQPLLYASVGISPFDVEGLTYGWQSELRRLCAQPRVLAIGEIGMDTTNPVYPHCKLQCDIFEEQLDLSIDCNLPVVVHSRGCVQEIIRSCKLAGIEKALFHCFTGTIEDLKALLDAGYYVSFSGIATFKQSKITDCIRVAPMDRILIETDSPYLAPVPFRGSTNHPALVTFVGRKIAAIKQMHENAAAECILQNFRELFNLPDLAL
jgi:TatD DNase family protein